MGLGESRFLPRGGKSAYESSKTAHLEDGEFVQYYPHLGALLSLAEVDGKKREPAKVSVFTDAGTLKACVADPHSNCVIFLTLNATESWADQIEAFLEKNPDGWREMKPRRS